MRSQAKQPLCQLHSVPMSLQEVSIAYGALAPYDVPYFAAAAQWFPNYPTLRRAAQ